MRRLFLLTFVVFVLASVASAGTILNFTNIFSGTDPGTPVGYLTAEFSDVSGGVQLSLTSTLTGSSFLLPGDALFLNFDNNTLLGSLAFTWQSGSFADAAAVSTGADAFKADGTGGDFDVLLTYGPGTKPFQNGGTQTYLITAGGAISASDFTGAVSVPDPVGSTTGGYVAATHVGGVAPDGRSLWMSPGSTPPDNPIPEPGTLLLLGSGLIGLAQVARRKFRA